RESLNTSLRMHAASHDAECYPQFTILHTKSGNDGLKRTLPRRINIRVLRVHREKFAAILKHESKTRHDDAAAHPAIIAFDERDHVAFVVSRAEINGVALIEQA